MMMQGVVNKARAKNAKDTVVAQQKGDGQSDSKASVRMVVNGPTRKEADGDGAAGAKPSLRVPPGGMSRPKAATNSMKNRNKQQNIADLALLVQKKRRQERGRALEEGKLAAVDELNGGGTEEPESETKLERCLECFGKIGINHITLIFILVLYALIGAAIFEATEESNEIRSRQDRKIELNASVNNLTASILALDGTQNRNAAIRQLIREYQLEEDLWPTDVPNWDFWGALFYAGTIFTTIGYGHYCPVTVAGRIATMLYAVVGIPLVLAVLSDLGKLLTQFFKRIYTYIRLLKYCGKKKRWASTKGETSSYLEWLESEELDIPIPVAIILLIGWIFLCAAVFCIWETEWSFFDAFYFFFISLTTIGLGDITPDHPRLMIAGCIFVIIGLSLISMVINLIQIKLEELKDYTADYIEEKFEWDTLSESDDEVGDEQQPKGGSQQNLPTSLGIFSTGMTTQKSASENQLSKVASKWQVKAGVKKRRRRRGIQTDESYLHDVRLRFPHTKYLDIPPDDLYKSRDDVNSLVDQLEFVQA